jgi:REP element-mobilizing transposase RayT
MVEVLVMESTANQFDISAYCVMPNHFHMLAIGKREGSDLLEFVEALKRTTTYESSFRQKQKKRATAGRPTTSTWLWQKKFYDHILRETDNEIAVAAYIWMNPVRAGLCADARDYPFSGSFTMDWKKAITSAESWVPDWKRKPEAERGP